MNTYKLSDALNPTAPPVEFVIPQPSVDFVIPQPSVPAAVSVQPHRSPPSMPVGKAEWSNDLCDCYDDCSEFCCACFCTPCYQYDIFRRANENFCSCIFGGLVPLRTKIRTERNIKGSICCDFAAVMCCPLCAMVQMGTEMKNTPAYYRF